jgi:hypothetical protein
MYFTSDTSVNTLNKANDSPKTADDKFLQNDKISFLYVNGKSSGQILIIFYVENMKA